MNRNGSPDILIFLFGGLIYINIALYAIIKLVKSRIPINQKVSWVFTMIVFQIIGLIIFLIYHDYYLPPDLRANVNH
jgi:hypothetical protein